MFIVVLNTTACEATEKCDSCRKELAIGEMAKWGDEFLCPKCTVEYVNVCDIGYCAECGELIMAIDYLWELDGNVLCGECAYEIGKKTRP